MWYGREDEKRRSFQNILKPIIQRTFSFFSVICEEVPLSQKSKQEMKELE